MFAIVECQNDIQLILKEDDKLRAAAQKEKQIRKVKIEDNPWIHQDWLDMFDLSEAYGKQQDKQQDDTKKYNQYVFCFNIKNEIWHIRVRTDSLSQEDVARLQTGIDPLSFCGREMVYDIGIPVEKKNMTARVCTVCEAVYLIREGEESDGDEETNQRGEAKG